VTLSALALLFSTATAYIPPGSLHFLAFAGFAFVALWIFNLALAIILLLRKSWFVLIPIIALLISLPHWNHCFRIWGKNVEASLVLEKPVTVMSYNTRMFDYYKHSGVNNTPEVTFDFILQQSPDIISFQEYYTKLKPEEYSPAAIAMKFRAYPHRYFEYTEKHKGNTGYGLAIYSKYPIIEGGAIRFDQSRNMTIYADIDINGTVVRVFNSHLESIGFQDSELEVLDSLDFRMSESQKRGLINISRKLTRALRSRATQAETISGQIAESPYPVIVCGDFNDIPVSYVYRKMRGKLKDAFTESGSGFGGTYNGRRLPSFRIDYIFHDPAFSSYNFRKFPVKYSDHYPIMTVIDLNPKR
jgi:endonuclease/exonuclease/phosphatase family metal-dependent hydrolase